MERNKPVQLQAIPAKMYRSAERVIVAVPMPGLQPEDISVQVQDGPSVTVHGELRGVLGDEKEVLIDEWNPGPYHRELTLPAQIDGERANVTYNNGVLVAVLPVAEQTKPANLSLDAVSPTQGARVGHQGKNMEPPAQSGKDVGGGEGKTSFNSGYTQ